jgi:hypothetical protein
MADKDKQPETQPETTKPGRTTDIPDQGEKKSKEPGGENR